MCHKSLTSFFFSPHLFHISITITGVSFIRVLTYTERDFCFLLSTFLSVIGDKTTNLNSTADPFMTWVMPDFMYSSSATFKTENLRTSGLADSFLNTLVVLVVTDFHKQKAS